MRIPELNDHGLLPVGLYDCLFSELVTRFGQNRWAEDLQSETRREILCPHRARLCGQLRAYLAALQRVRLAVEVLIDGSFVTEKPDPNDVDLIVVFPAGHDFSRALPVQEYRLFSKRQLRSDGYLFDIFVVASGDTAYETALRLFQQVRGRDDLQKGLLRIRP